MALFRHWMVPLAANRDCEPGGDADPSRAPLDFRTVFAQHFQYLWSSLRRLGVAEGDLEDIAHEVWLRVHAQLPQYDPEKPVRPWLFALALGAASNYRRLARHRIEAQVNPEELHDPRPFADESLLTRERNGLVHLALQQVPLEQRAMLVLHEMDETPVPEIANALGISVNTAYSRLRLGRAAFRRALELAVAQGGFP